MTDDRDPAAMHIARGAPGKSYARLGDDGVLWLIAAGKGLSIRMDAAELRRFAACALAVADKLDERSEAAAQAALQDLARAIS